MTRFLNRAVEVLSEEDWGFVRYDFRFALNMGATECSFSMKLGIVNKTIPAFGCRPFQWCSLIQDLTQH
jgi:hypothetical protein